MAFRMNRPVIKGTVNHKASIAKAKSESIVAQTRTQADAGLITASSTLGDSFSPKEIKYGTDMDAFKVPKGDDKKKEKKEKQPKVKKEKDKSLKVSNKTKRADKEANKLSNEFDSYVEYMQSQRLDNQIINQDDYEALSRRERKNLTKNSVKKDNIFEKGYKGIRDFIKEKNQKKSNERLKKAGEGPDSDYDFSELDNEPGLDAIKTEKYKSPEAGTKEGEELLSRTKAGRNKALQDAAKKHNVKVGDLEAKHIGPENEPLTKEEIKKYGENYVRPSDLAKRQFYPKQGVQGGFDRELIPVIDETTGKPKLDKDGKVIMELDAGTKWDDELGRFRKAEATTGTVEEQQKAVEKMKPKFPEGMDPNLATTGEIALNYDTNTYEYTQQYFDRLAKEKIEQQKVEPTSTTTEPVVEENKTPTTTEKPKVSDFRTKKNAFGGTLTAKEQYEKALKEYYSKSPMGMRDNRIYRNAIKGGVVQQNMIKSGYKPE